MVLVLIQILEIPTVRAFVNFSLDTIGIKGILKLMENKENRRCAFNECLAYHDGKEIHYFYGKHPRKFSK